MPPPPGSIWQWHHHLTTNCFWVLYFHTAPQALFSPWLYGEWGTSTGSHHSPGWPRMLHPNSLPRPDLSTQISVSMHKWYQRHMSKLIRCGCWGLPQDKETNVPLPWANLLQALRKLFHVILAIAPVPSFPSLTVLVATQTELKECASISKPRTLSCLLQHIPLWHLN